MPIWCHCMQGNRNVSTSVLSRDERKFVQSLTVKLKPIGQHGNSKASCWRYFGVLTDNDGVSVDEDRLYCRLCIDDQKALGDRGHLSKVTSFAATTSSGNMNLHLSQHHDTVVNSDNKVQMGMRWGWGQQCCPHPHLIPITSVTIPSCPHDFHTHPCPYLCECMRLIFCVLIYCE